MNYNEQAFFVVAVFVACMVGMVLGTVAGAYVGYFWAAV